MRKILAALMVVSLGVLGVACDDNDNSGKTGVDKDDTRVGPGDGKDETGPGR